MELSKLENAVLKLYKQGWKVTLDNTDKSMCALEADKDEYKILITHDGQFRLFVCYYENIAERWNSKSLATYEDLETILDIYNQLNGHGF